MAEWSEDYGAAICHLSLTLVSWIYGYTGDWGERPVGGK
jgi:hypothetical protein